MSKFREMRKRYTKQEKENIKHLKLRLPDELRVALVEQATRNRRSLNSEIIIRLIDSLE